MRARMLLPVLLMVLGCSDDGGEATTAAAPTTNPPTTAAAEPAGREVTFQVDSPPGQFLAPVCEGTACVIPATRTGATFTGDLTGTAVSAGGGAPNPDGGLSFGSYALFTGEISECGSGSFAYVESGRSADGASLHGDWTIVDGSGSGDLAGITGSGTAVASFGGDGSGTATATGVVECGSS